MWGREIKLKQKNQTGSVQTKSKKTLPWKYKDKQSVEMKD